MKVKYYVRVNADNIHAFDHALLQMNITSNKISYDTAKGISSLLYSVVMDEQQELILTLKFQIIGCMKLPRIDY